MIDAKNSIRIGIILLVGILGICAINHTCTGRTAGGSPEGSGIDPGRITEIENAIDAVGGGLSVTAKSIDDSRTGINNSITAVGTVRGGLDTITARFDEAQVRINRIEESCGRIEQLIEEIKKGGKDLAGDSD